MFHPRFPTATATRWLALVLWLVAQGDALRHAAYVLAGPNAAARTSRLIRAATEHPEPTARLVVMLRELYELLALDHVHNPDRIEFDCFGAIDPDSPVVAEICLLTDSLKAHLDALEESYPALFPVLSTAA